jgi:hypothetical protein
MNKDDWEVKKGVLPTITYLDPITNSDKQVPMTINGVEINLDNPLVLAKLNAIISYPPSLMHETIKVVESAFNNYFDDKNRVGKQGNLPLIFSPEPRK